jgi:hypothetical protein
MDGSQAGASRICLVMCCTSFLRPLCGMAYPNTLQSMRSLIIIVRWRCLVRHPQFSIVDAGDANFYPKRLSNFLLSFVSHYLPVPLLSLFLMVRFVSSETPTRQQPQFSLEVCLWNPDVDLDLRGDRVDEDSALCYDRNCKARCWNVRMRRRRDHDPSCGRSISPKFISTTLILTIYFFRSTNHLRLSPTAVLPPHLHKFMFVVCFESAILLAN